MFRAITAALGWEYQSADDTPYHLDTLWNHATVRQAQRWDKFHVDLAKLISTFTEYCTQPFLQTAYLDWVFLDAFLFQTIYILGEHINEDVLEGYDTGTWLPSVERMFANSTDAEKEHPILLEMKVRLILFGSRLIPTVVFLSLGLGCFFIGDGWHTCFA